MKKMNLEINNDYIRPICLCIEANGKREHIYIKKKYTKTFVFEKDLSLMIEKDNLFQDSSFTWKQLITLLFMDFESVFSEENEPFSIDYSLVVDEDLSDIHLDVSDIIKTDKESLMKWEKALYCEKIIFMLILGLLSLIFIFVFKSFWITLLFVIGMVVFYFT